MNAMSSVQLNNAAIRNYAAYQMQARLQQQLGSGQQMERLSSGSKLNKAADDATTGTTAQDGLQQLGSGQQRLQLIGSGQSITTTNAEETKVGDAVGTTFGDNGVTATISATGAALAAGGTDQRGVEGANVRDFDYSSEITRFAKTFASTAQLGQTPSGSIDRSSDPNITQRSQQTTGPALQTCLPAQGCP
ncbi:hypothetical protein [Methylogaea oryzae]|uniref:hypothetical protein n=1 Tax=Methylogaea oryzae TaxID=1295382 RepID=UPI0012E22E6F|nr:hypothetical protein [Methylogaea oryzae]